MTKFNLLLAITQVFKYKKHPTHFYAECSLITFSSAAFDAILPKTEFQLPAFPFVSHNRYRG